MPPYPSLVLSFVGARCAHGLLFATVVLWSFGGKNHAAYFFENDLSPVSSSRGRFSERLVATTEGCGGAKSRRRQLRHTGNNRPGEARGDHRHRNQVQAAESEDDFALLVTTPGPTR